MRAKYLPNLFKARYPILRGKDWVRRIEPEDLRVFVDIGLKANDHGKQGGRALVEKHGKEHMRKIARIGAIAANSIKAWNKAVREANEQELGVTFDF
jgi:hypothetical protein